MSNLEHTPKETTATTSSENRLPVVPPFDLEENSSLVGKLYQYYPGILAWAKKKYEREDIDIQNVIGDFFGILITKGVYNVFRRYPTKNMFWVRLDYYFRDHIRQLNSKRKGGKYIHVSLEQLQIDGVDIPAGEGPTIFRSELADFLKRLTAEGATGLSQRESIIFKYVSKEWPKELSLDELEQRLSSEERKVFRNRGSEREGKEYPLRVLLSCSRSTMRGRLAFARRQLE